MSKNDPSKEGKTIKPEETSQAVAIVSKGIQGVIGYTKSQSGLKKVLADEHAKKLLTSCITTFVQVDLGFEGGMRAMGEIMVNLLKQPEDLQRKAIEAICEQQGIPMIEFDPKAPRKSFALAIFAKFPEMHRNVQGSTDTVGALRLTSYMSAFKLGKEGQSKKRKGGGKGTGSESTTGTAPQNESTPTAPGTASELFIRLYTSATAEEQSILVRIAGRAGIAFEDWVKPADVK